MRPLTTQPLPSKEPDPMPYSPASPSPHPSNPVSSGPSPAREGTRQHPTIGLGLALLAIVLMAAALTSTALVPAALASNVPDFESAVGHRFGERITVHHQMESYLRTLAETSPRVTVVEQGTSWEGRELLLAIVTSPDNHARLDAIRETAGKIGDPRRVGDGELDGLLDNQPAIVWLGGSIHGFELSGTEGLLKLLERLSTANDPDTLAALDNTVVLIDPILNPDGRDAFAHFNHRRLGGTTPNPRRDHWANDNSGWEALAFRTGHYFFDTNRDWFAHTQRETQARVPTLVDWRPQVIIDAHEMGPDVEFYFDPPAEPFAVHFPDFAKTWFERFGDAYATAFDGAGFEYTQREMFNYYYPGYTTSYGSYQGAVGMLYEQGSSRGLALERSDTSVRTLADALEQQYTAAWAAVHLASTERRQLLSDYHAARQQALDAGQRGVRRYLIDGGGDPGLTRELVNLLMRNGIEVARLTDSAELTKVRDRRGQTLGTRSFDAGTYVVEAAQPQSPLLRTLLEPSLPMPKDFLAEARQRLDRGENPGFYDITAWSLPLLFDLPGFSTEDARDLSTESVDGPVTVDPVTVDPVTEGTVAADGTQDTAPYAYVFDGNDTASMGVLHHLTQAGYRAGVTLRPAEVDGTSVAKGSVVARVAGQDELPGLVEELSERYGVGVRGVSTARAQGGLPSLGGTRVLATKPVRVAILAEGGVHAYSFGWTWYTLEEAYGISTTVLRSRNVAYTPLDDFDTLIIPDLFNANALAESLGEGGIERIQHFIRDGGHLVVLANAVDFARGPLERLSLRSWMDEQTPGDKKGSDEKEGGDSSDETPRAISVPGAIVDAQLDGESWLTAGYGDAPLPFLVVSNRLYLPPKGPKTPGKQVVAHVADPLVATGHLWDENRERLPGAVLVYTENHGGGRVTAFTEDINYRAYFRGANRLFLNAVLLGPSAW